MGVPWSFGPSAVAAFIVFIGILIFVHELGHFLAAKYFDIKVTKFSLGFGPALVRFQYGETIYQIAAIPLGGYVKMVGDNPGEEVEPEDRDRAFTTAALHQRAIVALAGPTFNLVFPIVCFFAYNLLGPTVPSPIVGQMEIGDPADVAGLEPGDRIIEVDGERTWSFHRITELISARPGQKTPIKVERDGQEVALEVTPKTIRRQDPFGETTDWGIIGVVGASHGTGIGVAFPAANQGGFATGDELMKIGDDEVKRGEELARTFKKYAGQTVPVVVARPEPLAAGSLLYATAPVPRTLSVPVPAEFARIEDVGIAQSEMFLRRVIEDGAADRAGLAAGDQILEVDGRRVQLFWSFVEAVRAAEDRPLPIVVRRGGERVEVTLKNDRHGCTQQAKEEVQDFWDPGVGLGWEGESTTCVAMNDRIQLMSHWTSAMPPRTEVARLTIGEAFVSGVEQTGQVIGFVGLGIYKLLSGQISSKNVGGPIALFKFAAQAAEIGIFAYLRLLALISVNLGLINLLPIPIFDGGHLAFVAIEAIKRRPISMRTREIATLVGFVLIAVLFIIATRNDILSTWD
ncbi:MAG: RIP metalloprotease RseP [Deltaproteobacteria bacterium]|jgi:regulator of sigma E protease